MTITAHRPGDWITELFPKSMTVRQMQDSPKIWWRVCLMWIPPRDERFEYERDFGARQIEAVLNHQPLNMGCVTESGGQHIMFFFPERWLSTQEEYLFVSKLKEHPQIEIAGLTIVDLVTKSPLIISGFIADDIRIVKPVADTK